jgi:tRNA threonylcarbamoyladenosine biosynthesis protein TsaB
MNILALETSGDAGSVAAADGPRLVATRALDANQRSAKSLAPAIRELLNGGGWRVNDVGLIAVTVGPGSFTGLRVGVATAKVLAYALGARTVAANTLEVIAAQAPRLQRRLAVAMDAGRNQVFAATFDPVGDAPGLWHAVAPPMLVDQERWIDGLCVDSAVTGPALSRHLKNVPSGVTVVDAAQWAPRADTLAAIAWQRHLADAYDDVWKLAPLYLRKSAAEEKWEQH